MHPFVPRKVKRPSPRRPKEEAFDRPDHPFALDRKFCRGPVAPWPFAAELESDEALDQIVLSFD